MGRKMCLSHAENLNIASLETLLQRCSSMKCGASIKRYSFRTALLNIVGKFLKKTATKVKFSIAMSFLYAL